MAEKRLNKSPLKLDFFESPSFAVAKVTRIMPEKETSTMNAFKGEKLEPANKHNPNRYTNMLELLLKTVLAETDVVAKPAL